MRKSLVALAVFAMLGGGCGKDDNDNGTGPSNATIALVTATANPDQVGAVATADPNFPFAIAWSTQVKESAGVAATVTQIAVVLVDTKLILNGPSLSAIGSTSLPANGTLNFPLSLAYSLPGGGRLAVVSIIVDLTDSKGNRLQAAAQLRIL
jgi:hypothetical protein